MQFFFLLTVTRNCRCNPVRRFSFEILVNTKSCSKNVRVHRLRNHFARIVQQQRVFIAASSVYEKRYQVKGFHYNTMERYSCTVINPSCPYNSPTVMQSVFQPLQYFFFFFSSYVSNNFNVASFGSERVPLRFNARTSRRYIFGAVEAFPEEDSRSFERAERKKRKKGKKKNKKKTPPRKKKVPRLFYLVASLVRDSFRG